MKDNVVSPKTLWTTVVGILTVCLSVCVKDTHTHAD